MRSTSGMTCCHFFCSVVFSMPVCRKPIVGAADRAVSPSSSRTSRSTPCVLGCCGPMLTVMVSARISGIVSLKLSATEDTEDIEEKILQTDSFQSRCPPCPPWWRVPAGEGSSRERSLPHVADDVQHRPVHVLHPGGRVGWHVDVNRGGPADRAAVAAGQRDRLEIARARRLERGDDVRRAAAGADAECDVAAL